MNNEIYEKFHGISDQEYLELLIRAEKEPVIEGVALPGFPPHDFQIRSVGSCGSKQLNNEAYHTVQRIKQYAEKLGVCLNRDAKILDFGVGWGRMIRLFFKDLPSENIFGTDVTPKMIDLCNELLPSGRYSLNSSHPPIDFPDNMFDIIYSYSVFSHLRPDVAEEWIKEFSRILKPNGILYATVNGYAFLNKLQRIQVDSEYREKSKYLSILFRSMTKSAEKYRNEYDDGHFVYIPTQVEGMKILSNSFYGDCIIPECYIVNVFGKYLSFKSFNQYYGNNKLLPQAYFVLQNI